MSIVGSEQWMYSSGREFYEFPIEQSLRFNDNDSAYLSRTPASAGNRKTWTFSAWVKRGNLNANVVGNIPTLFAAQDSSAGLYNFIAFLNNVGNDVIYAQLCSTPSNAAYILETSQVFRDMAGWYHIVWSVDTTQATASDRAKLYVNGEQVTSFSTAQYPPQNTDTDINYTVEHNIGKFPDYTRYYDGYMADVNLIDGQALDATSFGEFKSGIWIPKDTSGLTFGTNGFRLQYGDSAAIGDDTSGNTNDWTVNNLVASDVVLDSPTNNFAVMNPNDFALYLSEGNLKVSSSAGSGSIIARSTILVPPNSGKWYFEGYNTVTGANGHYIGVWCPTGLNAAISSGYHDDSNFGVLSGHECVTYLSNGTIRNNSSSSTVTGLDDFNTSGDIVGVLLDMDAQTVQFYNNGTIQGSAQSLPNTTDPYGFFVSGHYSKGVIFNAGQDDSFAGLETPNGISDESGTGVFSQSQGANGKAWNSANLPTGAIDTLADETPEDYFNTVLWTGDNTTGGRSVTGVGFQPDLVYAKSRSAAYSPLLYDVLRGTGATAELKTDGTEAEGGSSSSERGYLNSFDADGFSSVVGSNGDNLYFNQTSQTYVAWNWKAGGSGVSNTDGSITSTVSVGATSQQNWFSIATYTGTGSLGTVGHGLDGTVPDMVIIKNRSGSPVPNWVIGNSASGWTGQLYFDTGTFSTNSGSFNNTAPTDSVVTINTDSTVNYNTGTYVMYSFANAEGLCKVGKFSGNGSTTDGVFVYLGFRPAFLLYKQTTAAANWEIIDNTRNPYNVSDARLFPSSSSAESTSETVVDLLSNGFKARDAYGGWNSSGQDYIYLAIAEQPFKYANAR